MDNGNNSHYNMRIIMIATEVTGSKLWLIHFYQDQLNKFDKVGLGNITEFGVKVTKELVSITQKRLSQLTVVYDRKITPQVYSLRKAIKKGQDKEKLLNESTNSNGTTATQSRKDNSNTRHERNKS